MGSAISFRQPPHPCPRRGILEPAPHGAEGLRHPQDRPGLVAQPLRRPHFLPPPATAYRLLRRGGGRAAGGRPVESSEGGFVFDKVKDHALAASRGGTDFALLFLAFSFFFILSALLLVGLLFRLNLDRRASEIGLLLATGLRRRTVWGCYSARAVCWRPRGDARHRCRSSTAASSLDGCGPGGRAASMPRYCNCTCRR